MNRTRGRSKQRRSKPQSRPRERSLARSRRDGRPRYQERHLRNEDLQNSAADPDGDVELGGHQWTSEADFHNEGDVEWTREALDEFCHCVSDHTPRTQMRPPPCRPCRSHLRWLFSRVTTISLWHMTGDVQLPWQTYPWQTYPWLQWWQSCRIPLVIDGPSLF
jgi:hypothetical protein